jgi:hypothetical protein
MSCFSSVYDSYGGRFILFLQFQKNYAEISPLATPKSDKWSLEELMNLTQRAMNTANTDNSGPLPNRTSLANQMSSMLCFIYPTDSEIDKYSRIQLGIFIVKPPLVLLTYMTYA